MLPNSLLIPLVAILASSAIARRPPRKRADSDGAAPLSHDEEKAIVVPGRYIVEFSQVSLQRTALVETNSASAINCCPIPAKAMNTLTTRESPGYHTRPGFPWIEGEPRL